MGTILTVAVAVVSTGFLVACNNKSNENVKPVDGSQEKKNVKPSTKLESKPKAKQKNRLIYQVGDKKVMTDQIDKDSEKIIKEFFKPENIAKIPANRRPTAEDIKNDMAYKKMQGDILLNYIKSQKIIPSKKDIEEVTKKIEDSAKKANMSIEEYLERSGITRADIPDVAAIDKMFTDVTSDKAIDEFIKKYPQFFDGTKIETAHILRLAAALDNSDKQQKAYDEIVKIQQQLKDKKIDFSEAANKNSQCPSGKDKKMGTFGYLKPMPLYSLDSSYSLGAILTKKGEVSPIVRSSAGYHLIKLINVIPGKEKIDPKNKQTRAYAQKLLTDLLLAKIMKRTRSECKIKFIPYGEKVPQDKPANTGKSSNEQPAKK